MHVLLSLWVIAGGHSHPRLESVHPQSREINGEALVMIEIRKSKNLNGEHKVVWQTVLEDNCKVGSGRNNSYNNRNTLSRNASVLWQMEMMCFLLPATKRDCFPHLIGNPGASCPSR